MSDTDTHASGLDETLAGDHGPTRPGARLEAGVTVERYVLESKLGSGAMGVVWAAHDPELDRKLAIKFLSASGAAQERIARLRREAQAMAKLSHPNVVTVHDVGQWSNSVFVAMEFIDGGTLGDWMEAEHSLAEILEVFAAAGRGLHAAHQAGIVHRDFKPDNVLMRRDGRVCVADFGLALGDEELGEGAVASVSMEHRAAMDDSDAVAKTEGATSGRLTQTGRFLGTPAYMAPEQHLGLVVDARSDQFAFCVSLWEAIYGKRPFRGDSVLAIALNVCEGGPPQLPDSPPIPTWLRRLLLQGLSTAARDRFENMDAVVEELARDRTRTRKAVWLGLGGVTAVAAAVLATVALTQSPAADGPDHCAATSEAIDKTWDDARRERVRAHFVGSELSYAAATYASVEAALDGYAREYADAKATACERTHHTGEQTAERYEQQTRCLDRSLREFDGFVAALETADDALVERSATAAENLSSPGGCLDSTAKAMDIPEPENRARVDELYLELADARASRLAQRNDEADETLTRVTSEAEALGHRPLELDAWLERGLLECRRNEAHAAELALSKAIALAVELDDDLALARAAARMIWVTSAETPDEPAGNLWRDVALAVDELPARARIEVLSEHASTLSQVGKHDEAIAQQRQAVEALEEFRESHPVQYGQSKTVLGAMMIRAGQYEDANVMIRDGIDWLSEKIGPRHPNVTPMRLNLALSLFTLEQFDEAIEMQQQVVKDYERQYGADASKAADARYNLGLYLARSGRQEAGIEQLERARAVYAKGDHKVWVAQTDLDISQIRARTSQPEGALETALDARNMLQRELGRTNLVTLQASLATVDIMLLLDRDEDAAREALEWLPRFQESQGNDAHITAKFELATVHAQLRAGTAPDDVRETLDHALGVLGDTEQLEVPPYSGIVAIIESRMLRPTDVEAAREKAETARKEFADETFAIERQQIDRYLRSL